MKRLYTHRYPSCAYPQVYEAYMAVLSAPPFKRSPEGNPYASIFLDIGMTFRYNINGGSADIRFFNDEGSTVVQVEYVIGQLVGARTEAYNNLIVQNVEKQLGVTAQKL